MIKYRHIFGLLVGFGLIYFVSTQNAVRTSITDYIVSIVRPVLIILVNHIVDPFFVYMTSGLMILVGILASVLYWVRVFKPTRRKLINIQTGVTRLTIPDVRRPADLHGAFMSLGGMLRQERAYLSAWSLLQKDFIATGRIPSEPFLFFVASDPDRDALSNRGLMSALPGYFTSIGLLFTFLGLVVALYFASRGFRSGNLDEARTAIQQLLSASSFKFITSIAALGSALFISIVHRYCQSVLQSESRRALAGIEAFISALREVESVSAPSGVSVAANETKTLIAAILALSADLSTISGRLEALMGRQHHVE